MPRLKYLSQVLNTFENIKENGAFSNTYDTSKVSLLLLWSKWLTYNGRIA